LGYLNMHYIDTSSDPQLKAVLQRMAHDYGLPVSGLMGEEMIGGGIYLAPPEEKERILAQQLETIGEGLWLHVAHPGIDALEQHVLVHAEPKDVIKHGVGNQRIGETNALISARVKEVVQRRGIELVDYRSL